MARSLRTEHLRRLDLVRQAAEQVVRPQVPTQFVTADLVARTSHRAAVLLVQSPVRPALMARAMQPVTPTPDQEGQEARPGRLRQVEMVALAVGTEVAVAAAART